MTDPDRRLARKARRGDRRALASLYERYRRRLFGFLVRSTGNSGRAEDLFQEVWVKVMQAIDRFDPDRAPFRAWLFQIAANAAVDRARRGAVRARIEARNPEGGFEEGPVAVYADPQPGPEQRSASREAGRALDAALDALPVDQRTAVLLRHQQGLTYPELAAALDVPEGTAKTRVHRGTASLREALKEWSGE